MEKGETLTSLADLAGKSMVGAGKGSTPEFGLRYLLSENGIDPDTGLSIDWKSEHSECVAALASGASTIALLPQPFVTVAQTKIEGLRVALDLTEEWDSLDNGSDMVTGVIVARKDVVEENPEGVAAFLNDYAESVEWVNANNADAAQLISASGIVEAASLHLIASIPNACLLEYCVWDTPIRHEIVRDDIPAINGYAAVPMKPGLGIEMDDKAIEKYRCDKY